MKKIFLCLIISCLLLTFNAFQSNAATIVAPNSSIAVNAMEKAKTTALISRLNDIYKMDKSKLTPSEKKSLRKEVVSIKNQVEGRGRSVGGGVYISGGALLIIIILLIILL